MVTARNYLLVLFVAMLSACAQLGLPTATTFQERLTAGYALNAEVRTTATTLLTGKKISSADAQNVLDQTNNARAGLDLARTISKTDETAADFKLTSVRTVLLGLQAYLATKKGN